MNFKHLFYFWKVASCGGVTRAAEALHTTPQTLSGQIKLLEERMGKALFRKEGRNLVLTRAGELAMNYAEEIFSLGSELEDMLRSDETAGLPMRFRVGMADALPNSIAQLLLEPVLRLETPVSLLCREWRIDRLLAELAAHRLDLVIADSPIPPGFSVKAWSHRLGASPMAFFAAPALAARCRERPFPENLTGQPLLLLGEDSAVRGQFEQWARSQHIRPQIAAEFDDTGLMKAFGRAGWGIFMAPAVLNDEICRNYGVEQIGSTSEIEQVYYAITVQRKITHPCTEAIVRSARDDLSGLVGKSS
jgi:LysR family transcriptional activator of nhaA